MPSCSEADEIDIEELHDVLGAKLGSIKWTVDSRGRIKVESKVDMRKRGLPSPHPPTPWRWPSPGELRQGQSTLRATPASPSPET